MAAPICAISLLKPSLSTRAVNEPSRVVGMTRDDRSPVVMYRSPASRSDPDSTTALVSSSANNGTPSALAVICSCIPHGNSLPPVTSEMICPVCSRDNRSRRSKVTCDSSSPGGKNSGLKLHKTKTRAVLINAMHRPSSSSVLESLQCASANSITTGRVSARSRTCRTNAAIVRSLCRGGVTVGDG